MPFSGIDEISRDQKASPCSLTVKGKVRCYFEESSRLGYHVGEDGVKIVIEKNERYVL